MQRHPIPEQLGSPADYAAITGDIDGLLGYVAVVGCSLSDRSVTGSESESESESEQLEGQLQFLLGAPQ